MAAAPDRARSRSLAASSRLALRRPGLLCAVWLALGCSGSTGTTPDAGRDEAPATPVEQGGNSTSVAAPARDYDEATDDGLPLWPRAAPFEVAPERCVVTTSRRAQQRELGYITNITYEERSYDSERRVVSTVKLDNQGELAVRTEIAHQKLDETGRTLVLIRSTGTTAAPSTWAQGAWYRWDLGRDERHNLIFEHGSEVDELDLDAPVAPPTVPDYSNSYDAAGLLVEHVRPTETFRYAHDAGGRCEFITGTYRVEQRTYDASGRLALQHFEPTPSHPDAVYGIRSYSIEHRYDEQGREIAFEQDGGGMFSVADDGEPDLFMLHTYQADGSVIFQHTDFLNDSTNDEVERNGQLRPAVNLFQLLSPGCQALEASLPAPSSQRCATD